MVSLLAGSALAGLLGSPHCAGMCGGFAAAAADDPVAWHVGRLSAYAALGAAAGGIGSAIPGPSWLATGLSAALMVWFAGRLAGVVPELHLPSGDGRRPLTGAVTRLGASLLRRPGVAGRLALGATSGLLPCGLVWTALGMAVGAGSAAGGALAMIAFGLGTVPLLASLGLGVRRIAQGSRAARIALAATVLAAGLGALVVRRAAEGGEPTCHPAP